jgi:hypothetical protein
MSDNVKAAKFVANYEILECRYESLEMMKIGFNTVNIIQVNLKL